MTEAVTCCMFVLCVCVCVCVCVVCLWFMLEVLMTKNENNSHAFLRKMVENIKQTKDAQCPDDAKANEVCIYIYIYIYTHTYTVYAYSVWQTKKHQKQSHTSSFIVLLNDL